MSLSKAKKIYAGQWIRFGLWVLGFTEKKSVKWSKTCVYKTKAEPMFAKLKQKSVLQTEAK